MPGWTERTGRNCIADRVRWVGAGSVRDLPESPVAPLHTIAPGGGLPFASHPGVVIEEVPGGFAWLESPPPHAANTIEPNKPASARARRCLSTVKYWPVWPVASGAR